MDAHDKQELAYGRQKIADANAFPTALTYEQQQTQAAFLATVTGNRANRTDVLPMALHGPEYDEKFSLDNALASMDVRDGVLTYEDALRGLSDAETARATAVTKHNIEQEKNNRYVARFYNTNMPALLVHLAGMEYNTLEGSVSTRDVVQMVTRFERLKEHMSTAGVPITSITTHEGAMEALEAMDRLVAPEYPIRLNQTLEWYNYERLCKGVHNQKNTPFIKPLNENRLNPHMNEYETDIIKPLTSQYVPHMNEYETGIIKPLDSQYVIGKNPKPLRDTVASAVRADARYAILTSEYGIKKNE